MKYGTKINFNLSPELRQRAVVAARQLRMTVSQLIRTALEEAMSLHEQHFREPERALYYIRLKPSEANTLSRMGYDPKSDPDTLTMLAEADRELENLKLSYLTAAAEATDKSILDTS